VFLGLIYVDSFFSRYSCIQQSANAFTCDCTTASNPRTLGQNCETGISRASVVRGQRRVGRGREEEDEHHRTFVT
jgi:hypothetical protein